MMATMKPGLTVPSPRLPQTAGRAAERVTTDWWHELLWVPAAAVLGFGVTALFSGWLELPRVWLVAVYAAVALPFLAAYARWARLDLVGLLTRHWMWGVAGAVVIGAFTVFSVERQDATPHVEGLRLAGQLLWLGVVYGLIDALLLSVLPVLATWRAFSKHGWTEGWTGKITTGAVALVASILVATVYHLGYTEFRDADLREPMFGNAVMSLGYILTQNPITAIGSHIAMHIAAVLQGGGEAVSQLPPHY
jgi:hypothetical protein